MPITMKFDKPPMGIAANLAFAGEQVQVINEALVTSDEPHCALLLERVMSFFDPAFQAIGISSGMTVNTCLAIVHSDLTAEIYWNNEITTEATAVPKRDVKAGEPLYLNDMADIPVAHLMNASGLLPKS